MFASITELESPHWREGMIDGLSVGYSLATGNGLRGRRLHFALLRRFIQLAPRCYRRYLRAYSRLKSSHDSNTPLLSFWQWRSDAANLAELVLVGRMFDWPPGGKVDAFRRILLLDAGKPSDGPYNSLRAHSCPLDPAPQRHDGLIDGYRLCSKLARDESLHASSFVDSVIEYMDALWPEDYRRYRYRYIRNVRATRTELAGYRSTDLGPRLNYAAWSTAVHELHDEVSRCQITGKAVSPRSLDLTRRLLCEPGEPLPTLAWTIVPKLQEEVIC